MLLCDAGEGTLGQLSSLLGPELSEGLACLCAVWIRCGVQRFVGRVTRRNTRSHMHADHHVGLVSVLAARASRHPSLPPLLVVGPTHLGTWLNTYAQLVRSCGVRGDG